MAQLNLIELAVDTGAELLFEQYRRELSAIELPPFIATAYEISVGRAHHRFGRFAQAQERLKGAAHLASTHGLNAMLFKAEEALAELEKAAPPVRESRPVPLDLEEVATAIRELRAEAGVG